MFLNLLVRPGQIGVCVLWLLKPLQQDDCFVRGDRYTDAITLHSNHDCMRLARSREYLDRG